MKTKDLLRTAVQQFHQTLDGAQSPACWQEELTHESRKLKRLQSACDWAEVPLGDAPTLVTEPIFGNCLEDVTAPSQPDTAPKAAQPPRRSPTRNSQGNPRPSASDDERPTPSPKRPSVDDQADQLVPEPVYRRRTLADLPDQCLDTEPVLNLPAEAHGSLLNRLHQADEVGQRDVSANRIHDPQRSGRQTRQQPSEETARQPRSSARRDAVTSTLPHHEHAASLDTQHMQSQTLQERVAASLARTARAIFGEAPKVDAQIINTGWDALVGEHDLPHGFLEQLTRDGSPNAQGESSDSTRSSASRDGGSDSRDAQHSRTPASADQGSNRHDATVSDAQASHPHNGNGAGFGDATALSQPSRTHTQPPGLPFAQALNRLEDVLGYSAGTSGVAASDALAPDVPLPVTPAIAPTPMLTPPRVDMNVPAIATAMVWRGAQAEVPTVAIGDDDMPRLAEMMKRILDADARRHGIDV